ncbi:MAG: hypothetical protein ABIM49_03820 [candidate division WOR-3 bacterium]
MPFKLTAPITITEIFEGQEIQKVITAQYFKINKISIEPSYDEEFTKNRCFIFIVFYNFQNNTRIPVASYNLDCNYDEIFNQDIPTGITKIGEAIKQIAYNYVANKLNAQGEYIPTEE